MLNNLLKTALRNIIKQKSYTLINVTGLTLGLVACITLTMWVKFHFSFDQFHSKADQLCRPILDINVPGINQKLHCGSTSYLGPMLKDEYSEIIDYTRLWRVVETKPMQYKDNTRYFSEYYYVDKSFFNLFDFKLLYGDKSSSLEQPNSIVLTKDTALSLFGDVNPVGEMLSIGNKSHVVTAVLQNVPKNSHLQFQALSPLTQSWLTEYNRHAKLDIFFWTYFLVQKGTNLENLSTKIKDFAPKTFPNIKSLGGIKLALSLQPFKDIHLKSAAIEYNQISWYSISLAYIYVFSVIAFLILFIASINYINLTTALIRRRGKEVGIRKAVGSSRGYIIWQFISESILLTMLSAILAFIIIELCMPLLNTLFDNQLTLAFENRWDVLGLISLITVVVGIATGWYPALVLSKPEPIDILKSEKLSAAQGINLRKVLVGLQFGITIILIIASLTIQQQLAWIQKQNLGFKKEQVQTFRIPSSLIDQYPEIKNELAQNSWITGMTALGPFDFPGFAGKQFEFDGQTDGGFWVTSCTAVDYNFVDFYGLEIIEGRDFSEQMGTDAEHAYIINETLKKKLGWETAVGKRFQIPEYKGQSGTVIGVVKDFKWRSMHESVEGCALFLDKKSLTYIAARTDAARTQELMDTVRELFKQRAPQADFEHHFTDQVYERFYNSERMTKTIVNVFSIWAIFVACIGLLGLVSHSTEQRTKEIGLRKVLGAPVSSILMLISKEFIIMICLAAVVAWPLAWLFARNWLNNFAYRMDIGFGIYIFALIFTVIIALFVTSVRVLKAATVNPIKSLRYE